MVQLRTRLITAKRRPAAWHLLQKLYLAQKHHHLRADRGSAAVGLRLKCEDPARYGIMPRQSTLG